ISLLSLRDPLPIYRDRPRQAVLDQRDGQRGALREQQIAADLAFPPRVAAGIESAAAGANALLANQPIQGGEPAGLIGGGDGHPRAQEEDLAPPRDPRRAGGLRARHGKGAQRRGATELAGAAFDQGRQLDTPEARQTGIGLLDTPRAPQGAEARIAPVNMD